MRIITRAADLAGHEGRAIISFKNLPLTGSGQTSEDLVENGVAQEVLDDLEQRAEGFVTSRSSQTETHPLISLTTGLWRVLTIRYQRNSLLEEGARLLGVRWDPRGTLRLTSLAPPPSPISTRLARARDAGALALGLAACQKGLSVAFTTAATLVHDLTGTNADYAPSRSTWPR